MTERRTRRGARREPRSPKAPPLPPIAPEHDPKRDPLLEALHERHMEMLEEKQELERRLSLAELQIKKLEQVNDKQSDALTRAHEEIARLKPAADLLAIVERRVRDAGTGKVRTPHKRARGSKKPPG
jgi:hypothetical protein